MVVPSHDRPSYLRSLLDALQGQELEQDRFEVVVIHDSSDAETEELLRSHPLVSAGVLRHVTLAPTRRSRPPSATSAGEPRRRR